MPGAPAPRRTLSGVATAIIDETWEAVAPSVPIARHTVLRHLSASQTPDPPLNDIGVAVSEAVTNVVHHAYRHRSPGAVRVRVEFQGPQIEVMVEDDGSGMRPRPDTPGLGLGLPLIATMAQRFDIQASRSGGTRVCMWFDRDPGGATLPI
jgi:serine/threonine-protein kinase RsbW/stage II sporulation protein AB (anti-sigma F factor)